MVKRNDGELKVTNHDYEWSPKFYGVVSGLFVAMYMVTLAIGNKVFVAGGIATTAGLLTFPLCTILSDILTEIYGFNRTRQVIWTTMVAALLFSAFVQIAVVLPPAAFWPHQDAFAATFGTTWRLALGGCIAWVIGEFSNSFIMSRMKVFQKAKNMQVRFIVSTMVAQSFDTLTVAVVAFAGTMPWADWLILVGVAWVVKVGYEIVLLPVSVPLTRWVKKLEGVEHFDNQKLRIA